jgi:protein TonB
MMSTERDPRRPVRAHQTPDPETPPPTPEKEPPPDIQPVPEAPPVEEPRKQVPIKA